MFTLIAITCLFGAVVSAPSGDYGIAAIDAYTVPHYQFNYAVNDPHTGDHKSQSEIRDGDVVKGSYSLAEPDGTVRVVEYSADSARGFNAIVKRVGAAGHPQNLIAPIVAKQIVAPIAPIVQPIAAPIINDWSLNNLGGWGNGLGHGLGWGSWNLGGLGGWKH